MSPLCTTVSREIFGCTLGTSHKNHQSALCIRPSNWPVDTQCLVYSKHNNPGMVYKSQENFCINGNRISRTQGIFCRRLTRINSLHSTSKWLIESQFDSKHTFLFHKTFRKYRQKQLAACSLDKFYKFHLPLQFD